MKGPFLHAHSLTSSDERGDFKKRVADQVWVQAGGGDPVLLVVKKNASVLRNLFSWATDVQKEVDPETGLQIVRGVPLLVIDDEADYASVNTKARPTDENGQLAETTTHPRSTAGFDGSCVRSRSRRTSPTRRHPSPTSSSTRTKRPTVSAKTCSPAASSSACGRRATTPVSSVSSGWMLMSPQGSKQISASRRSAPSPTTRHGYPISTRKTGSPARCRIPCSKRRTPSCWPPPRAGRGARRTTTPCLCT